MSEIHYCRVPLPESDERGAKIYATRVAVSELLTIMEAANADPTTGQFRISYDLDSTLTRTLVLAEWRPRTEPKADQPSPHRNSMPFMTVIPTRRPTHKLHLNMGHAKNAINNALYGTYGRAGTRERMELCKWVDGEGWVTEYDFPPGTKQGDAPWRKK